MPRRTRAQRRWIRKGYRYEMIPLRPHPGSSHRYSYLMRGSEMLTAARIFAAALEMQVRPVCQPLIHNGGTFR